MNIARRVELDCERAGAGGSQAMTSAHAELRWRVGGGALILVTMTRTAKRQKRRAGAARPGHWILQDAKARFSELVRAVHEHGPQRVTVHGRDEVVVVTAQEYYVPRVTIRSR
jgi:prevent-host-death family protein